MSTVRKSYDSYQEWNRQTGETLSLMACDERTFQNRFYTRYVLTSPKGVLVDLKIADAINESFIAW